MEMDQYIIEINRGFESIRVAMAKGFKEAAKDTADIHSELATVSGKVNALEETVKEYKKEQDKKESEMKLIEKDVKDNAKATEKNTQFRKNVSNVLWTAAKVLIVAVTITALYVFVINYLATLP